MTRSVDCIILCEHSYSPWDTSLNRTIARKPEALNGSQSSIKAPGPWQAFCRLT